MKQRLYYLGVALLLVAALAGCRKSVHYPDSEREKVPGAAVHDPDYVGMFVLNSGGKGTNETTLDYMDFTTGTYIRNIYAEKNPDVEPTLGDNGVDIAVHEGKLYVMVQGSNRVRVLDVQTFKLLGELAVNDCRSVCFDTNGNGYACSYLKPNIPVNRAPRGEVVRFDIATLQETGRATVGCQPSQGVVKGNYLYVCNSGEYRKPQLDNTISVVSLEDEDGFTQVAQIEVSDAPYGLVTGNYPLIRSTIWVANRVGMGSDKSAFRAWRVDADGDLERFASWDLDLPSVSFVNSADTLYVLSGEVAVNGRIKSATYRKVALTTRSMSDGDLLSGAVREQIESPTSIAVMPDFRYILITDAKNFTSSGMLFCCDADGNKLWNVRTGIFPVKMAFVPKI